MLNAGILGISLHDPNAYIDLPVILLLLITGLLIRKISPRGRANAMLLKTALAGALVVFLYWLSIEIFFVVHGGPFDQPYPSVAGVFMGIINYSWFYGWYLEGWLFLQFFFERRWESQGVSVDEGRRQNVRILTAIPIAAWILLGIALRIFWKSPRYLANSYTINYFFWLFVFEIVFSIPYFFALRLKPREQEARSDEMQRSPFHLPRLVLLALGLAFLQSLGTYNGNICLAIFLIALLIKRLINRARQKALSEFQPDGDGTGKLDLT